MQGGQPAALAALSDLSLDGRRKDSEACRHGGCGIRRELARMTAVRRALGMGEVPSGAMMWASPSEPLQRAVA